MPVGKLRKKYDFFASLKSMKKGVRFISQRYGDPDPDPDPHQNVTDPQHCFLHYCPLHFVFF
jgi:hypothetical protein